MSLVASDQLKGYALSYHHGYQMETNSRDRSVLYAIRRPINTEDMHSSSMSEKKT